MRAVLPGLNGPTVIEIADHGHFVAVHAVVRADTIYRTIAQLRALGARGHPRHAHRATRAMTIGAQETRPSLVLALRARGAFDRA